MAFTGHALHDQGSIITGTAITDSFQNVLTMIDDADILFIENTCDANLYVQVPEATTTGTVDLIVLAFKNLAIDYRAGEKRLAKGIIKVKYVTGAPTQGYFTVFTVRGK